MFVRDAMNRDVVVFSPKDTLDFALKTFARKGVSGAPVVSADKLVGMISEYDIIKAVDIHATKSKLASVPHLLAVIAGAKNKDRSDELRKSVRAASDMKIGEFMTRDPISISKDADILEAARLIDVHKVNRLPVTEKGKLLGIVTRSDIIRAVARMEDELLAAQVKSKKAHKLGRSLNNL
jgi:CBS domain-containing protein